MKTEAQSLLKRLCDGERMISDGAWGTQLQARGLMPGVCPELWNIERREDVLAVAAAYVASGVDMIETNSFGASRLKLDVYGLSDQVVTLNREAAAISRQAIGASGWVLGSMGPTGKMLLMGDVSEAQLSATFAEQAAALAAGGADVACIETMSALDEALLAVNAVREHTDMAVACTFTFEPVAGGDYRTMMGVDPETMAQALLAAGADIIGANCGTGFAAMIEIVRRIRTVAPPEVPVLVHANAGVPHRVGEQDVFPDTPDAMAALAPALCRAGATIIGGCCGTTPRHIAAIAGAVRGMDREAKA